MKYATAKIQIRLLCKILPALLLCVFLLQNPAIVKGQQNQNTQKAGLVVQTGHTGIVNSVVFSIDGKILVSAGLFGAIKLWDITSGRELRTLSGHNPWVTSLAISPNGKILASGSSDTTIKLWDFATGRELQTFVGHEDGVNSLSFSSDGKILASGGGYLSQPISDKTIKLWDVTSGKLVRTLSGHTDSLNRVAFSPNGKTIASSSRDKTIKLWDTISGKEIRTISGLVDGVWALTFSPDGKWLASGSSSGDYRVKTKDHTIKLWDVSTGKKHKNLSGHTDSVKSIAFSVNGKTLISGSSDKTIKVWDVTSGNELRTLSGHTDEIYSVNFSPDGKTLASGSKDTTIKLWNIVSGKELKELSGNALHSSSATFSPNGNIIASGSYRTVKLWNVSSGKELRTLSGHNDWVWSVEFSPDGKILAAGNRDKTIKLWDIASGKELRTLSGHTDGIIPISFSPNGKMLASGSRDKTIKLWDIDSGKELKTFSGHTNYVLSVTFSLNGKLLASGSKTIKVWDISSGKELKTLLGHSTGVDTIAFSPDGKILGSRGVKSQTGRNRVGIIKIWDVTSGRELYTFNKGNPDLNPNIMREVTAIVPDFYKKSRIYPMTSDGKFLLKWGKNGRLNLTDVKSGKLLVSFIALGEKDWAVVTPDGLYDASPGARKLMHYIIGLEPITLEQMKDAYYVPGLLQKIYKGEPLPKVELFSKNDLFPLAEYEQPKPGQESFSVKLKNRGGGIGQVQVLVNGKEFIRDARPIAFDPNEKEVNVNIDLKDAPLKAGEENKIEVVARNSEGSLSSRGSSRGADVVVVGDGKRSNAPPNIYAIIAGISDYTGNNLDLNFAAKDAESFAKAVEIGAVKLLGDESKVHIRLLTSNGDRSNLKFNIADARISTATKADIENAFADFKDATPNDVFIVYLAGHGVSLNLNQNLNRFGGDTYLYLTQEATTNDRSVLVAESVRKAMTLSSEELKELMKQNKALKQVLILDTCAAGALTNSLVAKRDLPSDQIRAIERLKDNTGFFVLMGSAADAVSYEASQYGQGLLTYSLLQGMKGAKLRENQFADVSLLFGYAQEQVPNMAKNIGGVQRPLMIIPDTSASFDIGKFTAEEQKNIELSSLKPLILRPNLQNEELFIDNLKLTAILRRELRETSYVRSRGETPIVFVEADEMSDAITPTGRYSVEGETLTIKVVLAMNGKKFGEEISVVGKLSKKENLIKKLVEEIVKGTKGI